MSVYQLKDGRWIVRYRQKNGHIKQVNFGRGFEAEKKARLRDEALKLNGFVINNWSIKPGEAEKSKSMDEASAVDKLVSELNRWYKSGDIKTEVETKVGFVDILTLDELIEVKNINQWKNALGQLLAYGRYYPDKRLRMHLFSGGSIKRLEKIIEVCQDFEITITHDTGLYLIPDNIKNIVRARKHRQRMTPIPCDIETKRKAINKLPSLDVGY